MKRIVKAVIAAVMALTMCLSLFGCVKPEGKPEDTKANETKAEIQSQADSTNKASATDEANSSSASSSNPSTPSKPAAPAEKSDLSTALFIGDSRTVGLKEYTDLKSDFFCDVGLSAKNSLKKTIPVEGVGKVTLDQLLAKKQYSRVYIMLGINEIGGRMESIVNNYKDVIDFVKTKQPNAAVIIMANLHVTKARSDTDASINNERINEFNNEVKKFADGKTVFYIDVNTVFDDKDHALKDDMTSDNVHLYAKYYKEWAAWIAAQPLQ